MSMPTTTPAGWYPDPSGAPGLSYWTGTDWGQPEPPRKSSGKKIAFAVGGAFAVLIAIGGIAAHGDGGGESGTKSATTVAKAPSYSAAAPSTPSVKSWGTQAQPVLTAIQGDFNDLSAAADGGDYSGMRASCRSLEGNLDDLNGLLPSPDQAVTLELRGAIDDYRQMISICRTLGPSSTTGEVSEMASLLNSGTDHVKAATEAIG